MAGGITSGAVATPISRIESTVYCKLLKIVLFSQIRSTNCYNYAKAVPLDFEAGKKFECKIVVVGNQEHPLNRLANELPKRRSHECAAQRDLFSICKCS